MKAWRIEKPSARMTRVTRLSITRVRQVIFRYVLLVRWIDCLHILSWEAYSSRFVWRARGTTGHSFTRETPNFSTLLVSIWDYASCSYWLLLQASSYLGWLYYQFWFIHGFREQCILSTSKFRTSLKKFTKQAQIWYTCCIRISSISIWFQTCYHCISRVRRAHM